MRSKQTCIFVLTVKPTAALKLLRQIGCPNTCVPPTKKKKERFFSISIQLKLNNRSKLAF